VPAAVWFVVSFKRACSLLFAITFVFFSEDVVKFNERRGGAGGLAGRLARCSVYGVGVSHKKMRARTQTAATLVQSPRRPPQHATSPTRAPTSAEPALVESVVLVL